MSIISLTNIHLLWARLDVASHDSPIAIFKTNTPGHVNAVFANTVATRRLINAKCNDLIGVYDNNYKRFDLESDVRHAFNDYQ